MLTEAQVQIYTPAETADKLKQVERALSRDGHTVTRSGAFVLLVLARGQRKAAA